MFWKDNVFESIEIRGTCSEPAFDGLKLLGWKKYVNRTWVHWNAWHLLRASIRWTQVETTRRKTTQCSWLGSLDWMNITLWLNDCSLRRSLARWSLRSPTVRRGLVLMHVVLVSCCGLAFGRESAFCPGRRTPAGRKRTRCWTSTFENQSSELVL